MPRCWPSQFQSAADWYAQAEAADGDGSSRPYITMGLMALALAEGNVVGLTQLWSANDDQVADWGKHQTHVLPAAVCTLAASRHSEKVRERLPGIIRSLVDNRYAVEAAFLLKELPEECRLPVVREVELHPGALAEEPWLNATNLEGDRRSAEWSANRG